MKKNLFFAALAIMGLASCGNDLLVDNNISNEKNDVISFENTLTNNSTRAVKTAFTAGDAMGIYGFQEPGQSNQTRIFNNQKVDFNGASWSYSPLKYWNGDSRYVFYGIYPYATEGAKTYTFDGRCFNITDFDAATGTDVMIAEENYALPFNTVTMNFNHLLSNVNFNALLSSNVASTGISNVTVNDLTITGLKSIGSFTQRGFDANDQNVSGTWSDLNGEFDFDMGQVTTVTQGTSTNLISQKLSMPQPLQATLFVEYTIYYTDGSASTFRKSLPLESIKAAGVPVTEWNMNTIYNYTMTLDPTKAHENSFDPTVIDWDGSTNGDLTQTPNSRLVGPDANGNYWVYVDDDNDPSTPDVVYPVVWEDIDGDGMLEGGVDEDGDGHIDNVDNGFTNDADATDPNYGNVTDGNSNNPGGKDVILVDTDGDGNPDTQLEREPGYRIEPTNPTDAPDDPTSPSGKAYTIDWNGSLGTEGGANSGAADETAPVKYSRLVLDADGNYYVEFDVDHDGVYNGAADTRYLVLWADLDGDGKEEGYIGNMDNDNVNSGTNSLITDGNSKNPAGYDVILIDTDGDGICDTQLERVCNGNIQPSSDKDTVITFDAVIENWSNAIAPDVTITK